MLTLNERMMLREIQKNSTPVVAWYAHVNGDGDPEPTVRGPFHRWFKVTGGESYPKDVANGYDDAKFAAAAMNNLIPLLDDFERVKQQRDLLYACLSHALAIDYFVPGGSTEGWAEDAIAEVKNIEKEKEKET